MSRIKLLMLLFKSSSAVVLATFVASCGFRPAYLPSSEVDVTVWDAMSGITIQHIPKRSGQLLKNELETLIQPNGKLPVTRYLLSISLLESAENLSVKKSAFATRANLTIRAEYILTDAKTKKKLFTSRSKIVSGFNIFSEEYATLAAEENARKRGLLELAQDIRTRLSAFLLKIL